MRPYLLTILTNQSYISELSVVSKFPKRRIDILLKVIPLQVFLAFLQDWISLDCFCPKYIRQIAEITPKHPPTPSRNLGNLFITCGPKIIQESKNSANNT